MKEIIQIIIAGFAISLVFISQNNAQQVVNEAIQNVDSEEEVVHEEILLTDAIRRIRDVKMGPDGYLYLLTDESNGGLYRIEPD